jgi:hypothetical protein
MGPLVNSSSLIDSASIPSAEVAKQSKRVRGVAHPRGAPFRCLVATRAPFFTFLIAVGVCAVFVVLSVNSTKLTT